MLKWRRDWRAAMGTYSFYRCPEHMRPIILACSVLCYLPVMLNRHTSIPTSSRVRRALSSELLQGGLLVVLGAAASLLTDDALYLIEHIRITKGFQWSRRMLILSIVVPYILMYIACLRDNFALFFSSYHASQILHTYSIFEPLVLTEVMKWKRFLLYFVAYGQAFSIFIINYYYFYTVSLGVYSFAVAIFSITVVIEFVASILYLIGEWRKGPDGDIAVTSFSFCVLMNILVKIIVPLSFGVVNWPNYHDKAIFAFIIINTPILVIATILPGRIARHDAVLTKKKIIRFISHEIRTPMNTIHLGIDELLQRCEQAQMDVLNEMKAASDLAVDTLNDLISQEGFDENPIALDVSEEQASSFLTNLIPQCERHAAQGKFLFNVMYDADELQYVTIIVDKHKMYQALRSIIINSSRMTTIKGLVTLRCSIHMVPSLISTLEPTCELLIEISNDGPGISREMRNKIFSSDQLTALDFGTGMGTALSLWTAKRIIERHEGRIEVKPNLPNDHGCVFFIRLPIEKVMDRSGSTHAASSHRAIMSSNHSKDNDDVRVVPKFNCLIVDDAPVVRKMIGRVVQDLFATIAYATNGEEAAQLLYRSISSGKADDKFDIIFMDRCMPVKDGIEATRDIRNMGFQGVILGVTGDALAEDVDAFLQAGADKVVTKPVHATQFAELVEDYKMGRRTVTPRTKSHKIFKKGSNFRVQGINNGAVAL